MLKTIQSINMQPAVSLNYTVHYFKKKQKTKNKSDDSIHLLTGYEGINTFNVSKVSSTCSTKELSIHLTKILYQGTNYYLKMATSRKIIDTEGKIKVLLPEYQVYKCFIIMGSVVELVIKLTR
ncbi:hypothetical protein BAZSYMA_ACONTIG159479_0 [Bathymodiolus azoricus thioautotrophic gill symbiont]|uniref:Uncharacterized protein n=1 Tax=Bathymodiolus azoricus thioautotrophic gill symbiont TaxID=235205 RepID=A0A1H6MRR8_9GAMM|nr:hypothetical protein BAZSYMA_ACONTIG159479_0 [Bathymodiolus azoricus thioautotrophic gill symbiont]